MEELRHQIDIAQALLLAVPVILGLILWVIYDSRRRKEFDQIGEHWERLISEREDLIKSELVKEKSQSQES